MQVLVHIVTFLCSAAVVWYFGGILVESVSRLAVRYKKTGFITAFFVLGFLTSIGELSVAANSSLVGVPSVSVGNLVGASFVLLFFIIPVLAIAGGGVAIKRSISAKHLIVLLALVILPVLLVIDGSATKTEGLLAIIAYSTVAYALYRARGEETFDIEATNLSSRTLHDIVRTLFAGAAIFAASHFLVEQAVYFASALHVPASLIGLLLISIGTNLPEIVIALRSLIQKRVDIAFGDYLGSASMNTLIFGLLALANGSFLLESKEFIATGALMTVGALCLFLFARTKYVLSRGEGIVLILFYVAFVAVQVVHIARFSDL